MENNYPEKNETKLINFNLGIKSLLPEWKAFFSTKYLTADLIAGITVAFIAIPLSLAIALASGVSPGTGLVTAIIAGIVCALFGGTRLTVSGPAAAMAVLIAANVEQFGVTGLTLICLVAGAFQLLSGMLGFGKLARYVPIPVIAGFTAGIGVIIIIGQLPRAVGLNPPAESHVFSVLKHLAQYFHSINITCLLLVFLTLVLIHILQKISTKIPAILLAVVTTTAIVYFFHLKSVPLIGAIPNTLPMPHFPHAPGISFSELLLNGFSVYLLASLETLLSSNAIDKVISDKKHNPNQELIGQGLGNIAVSLFGGIPITGVIARSLTNVRAGAKTRRASIIHSLFILLAVFALAPLMALIPLVALTGVLFFIAFSMINVKEFYRLWTTLRAEAIIYALTFFTIIFVDLIAGVQIGMLAAGLIILLRVAKTHLHISTTAEDNIIRLSLSGSLTFLSSNEITKLEERLEKAQAGQTVIVDLSHIINMDSSGAAAIIDLYKICTDASVKFYIKGLPRHFESLFQAEEDKKILDNNYLVSETELRDKESNTAPTSFRGRLIHGVQRFCAERKRNDKRLFEYLAAKQDPHTLFITCSDSRITPNQITSADPGELFIVRNVGNFVPPYQSDLVYSEAAALDFALANLNVTDVVVCGHMNCGAIKACMSDGSQTLAPKLQAWIDLIKKQLKLVPDKDSDELARENVLNQIANLKFYPVVQARLAAESLTIHGWFFDFENGLMYELNQQTNKFEPILAES